MQYLILNMTRTGLKRIHWNWSMCINTFNSSSMIFITSSLLISLDGDNASIINDKIASKFTESSPDVKGRSMEAIKERWKKMLEIYKFCIPFTFLLICTRYIIDFNVGRVRDSTKQSSWFEIKFIDQKRFLNDKIY